MMERISSVLAILFLWSLTFVPLCHPFAINSNFVQQEIHTVVGFTFHSKHRYAKDRQNLFTYHAEVSDDAEGEYVVSESSTKMSLEAKMKTWEATEQEIKAATLGGVIPKSSSSSSSNNQDRSGAFDVGLYIAFPIMVMTGLFLAVFPLVMGTLDVSNVGPPPTV
jgi:hypothetical protein